MLLQGHAQALEEQQQLQQEQVDVVLQLQLFHLGQEEHCNLHVEQALFVGVSEARVVAPFSLDLFCE